MDKKKLAIGFGIAGAIGTAAYFLTRKARAAGFVCPVCGDEFSTLEELQYHFTMTHPREEILIEWQ